MVCACINSVPCAAGTSLRYVPGLITGGAGLRHDCGRSRAIGYFLEPLVCLSLFGKKVLHPYLNAIDIIRRDCCMQDSFLQARAAG